MGGMLNTIPPAGRSPSVGSKPGVGSSILDTGGASREAEGASSALCKGFQESVACNDAIVDDGDAIVDNDAAVGSDAAAAGDAAMVDLKIAAADTPPIPPLQRDASIGSSTSGGGSGSSSDAHAYSGSTSSCGIHSNNGSDPMKTQKEADKTMSGQSKSVLKVGLKVNASFGGQGGDWYPGVISRVYNDPEEAGALLYDIAYDDGDTDKALRGYFIQPRGKKRKLDEEVDDGTPSDNSTGIDARHAMDTSTLSSVATTSAATPSVTSTFRELIFAALQAHGGRANCSQIFNFVGRYRITTNLKSRLAEYEGRSGCWRKTHTRQEACGSMEGEGDTKANDDKEEEDEEVWVLVPEGQGTKKGQKHRKGPERGTNVRQNEKRRLGKRRRCSSEMEMLQRDELAYAKMSAVPVGAAANTVAGGVVGSRLSGSAFKNGDNVMAWWKEKWLRAFVKNQWLVPVTEQEPGVKHQKKSVRTIIYEVLEPKRKFSSWQVGSEGITAWDDPVTAGGDRGAVELGGGSSMGSARRCSNKQQEHQHQHQHQQQEKEEGEEGGGGREEEEEEEEEEE
jgi:hypothetical protein